MSDHERQIDYIEFPTTNVNATKRFYEALFGWKFTDYGPDYTSFEDGRLTGGFYKVPAHEPGSRGPLIVIYSSTLRAMDDKVIAASATISREIFSFPGGFRFQFVDPGGNELAIWSETDTA